MSTLIICSSLNKFQFFLATTAPEVYENPQFKGYLFPDLPVFAISWWIWYVSLNSSFSGDISFTISFL